MDQNSRLFHVSPQEIEALALRARECGQETLSSVLITSYLAYIVDDLFELDDYMDIWRDRLIEKINRL